MYDFSGENSPWILPGAFAESMNLEVFPEATVPVFQENDYLLRRRDADYWTLANYYLPQSTNCGCSAASAAMAMNALRRRIAPGTPPLSDRELMAAVDDAAWLQKTAEDGGGVTMADFGAILRRSLQRLGIPGSVEMLVPAAADRQAHAALRRALIRNEASPNSIMLAYYNQSVVTGDADGGLHVSPIGAFNAEEDRVLLMDVDRECHFPYWTSTATLLDALVTPDPDEDGHLANETGGCFLISAAAS